MRVGIIGAGQLGQMLGFAARGMDIECHFVDPSDAPPAAAAGKVIRRPFDDAAALAELADQIGHANLIAVINKFLEEIDTRWSALEQANTNVDRAREAHTLASTCQSFGLPSIGEKIACIERHAKFGDQAGEPPCIATTGKELRLGANALEAAIARYRSED